MRLKSNVLSVLKAGFQATLMMGVLSVPALAGEQSTEIDKVRQNMKVLLPDVTPDSIEPAPLPGLYQVVVGTDVVYISADGRYLVQGSIIDLETRQNLTAPVAGKARVSAIQSVGEENMVIFGAKDAAHTVTVFTDIDCGYCRKLHAQMDEYNAKGIRIRYLFFPRAGIDSDSYRKAVAVWCSEDRKEALTRSKAGGKLEQKECDNPVADHYELGQHMGVTGTPALVLSDGEMLPGYIPPERLADYLEYKRNGGAKQ